ncbi:hypothetical protein [Rhizobium chutanense]|uniref:hypothetical protein n=1 Tax=Rhizobium chutanense TaxID=2035448 RepID=UPI000F86847F|nr:hypothetical protein [Rhizobium chutanense]
MDLQDTREAPMPPTSRRFSYPPTLPKVNNFRLHHDMLMRMPHSAICLGGFCNVNVNFVDNTVISFGQKVAATPPFVHKIA